METCFLSLLSELLFRFFPEKPAPGYRRYFQHAHFIPIVGVGKRGEYNLVHGDVPRQQSFETTLRFTGPVPADSRQ